MINNKSYVPFDPEIWKLTEESKICVKEQTDEILQKSTTNQVQSDKELEGFVIVDSDELEKLEQEYQKNINENKGKVTDRIGRIATGAGLLAVKYEAGKHLLVHGMAYKLIYAQAPSFSSKIMQYITGQTAKVVAEKIVNNTVIAGMGLGTLSTVAGGVLTTVSLAQLIKMGYNFTHSEKISLNPFSLVKKTFWG